MSDLISRSELINAMNTLDKFGCNEHGRLVRLDSTNNEEYAPYVHYEDMVKCVNDMPTAYSVDRVVQELEEMKMRYFLTIANTGDEKSDFAYENVGNALDKAIEIVKHGCVSDDVCECRRLKGYNFLFKTSCGNVFDMENGFKFCPYCGKKIKVVE